MQKPLSVWVNGAFKGQRDSLYLAKKLAEESDPNYIWNWNEIFPNSWRGQGRRAIANVDDRPAPLSHDETVFRYTQDSCYTKESYREVFNDEMNLQDWIESHSMSFSDHVGVEVFYRHWSAIYQPHEVPYMLHELLELQRRQK